MKNLRGYLSPQARLTSLLFTAWYSGFCMSNTTSGHWICKNVFFDQHIASMFGKQGHSQHLFKDWKASETGFQNCVNTDEIICMKPILPFLLHSVVHLYHESILPFVITSIEQNLSSLKKEKYIKNKQTKTKKREIGEQLLIIELLTWKL